MNAIRIHAPGGPEALRFEQIDVPSPGPGQALVKLAAVGLNFIDVQYRQGNYPPPSTPFTPGMEGAGTVEAVGPDVSDVAVGDRVAYTMVIGTYAQFAVVPVARLVRLPPHIDLKTAAAVMLQGTTAHYLTSSTFPLNPGDTVLVHAAAGGVGQLIVQAARIRGARVIGTAGTPAKAALAQEAGASEVILYAEQDFEVEVKRLTNGRGVDVVYDSVGKDTFAKSLNCLRPRGGLAIFGFSSGPVTPLDPATLGAKGSLYLTRPGLNQYIATRDELLMRTRDVFTWLGDGRLKLKIEREYPLAEAAQSHIELQARRTTGKVLLIP
jgi:NADPH2:quinone reductase